MTNGHFPIMDYMGSLTVRHEYTTQIVTQNIFASNVVKNITEGNRKGISTIFCTEGQHKVIYVHERNIYIYNRNCGWNTELIKLCFLVNKPT